MLGLRGSVREDTKEMKTLARMGNLMFPKRLQPAQIRSLIRALVPGKDIVEQSRLMVSFGG